MVAARVNSRLRTQLWLDPLYKLSLVVMQGPFAKARTWISNRFGEEVWPVDDRAPAARTICHSRGEIIMWFGPTVDPSASAGIAIIAHEALHAAAFGLRDRGLKFCPASEEAFAYFIEYLTRELHARLQKRR
jgi:hypothetical protein